MLVQPGTGLNLRSEGLPIKPFYMATSIPRTEKPANIIEVLQAPVIKHVRAVDGIRQVVTIAAASSDFPAVCQWTGGRAGGHRSYEMLSPKLGNHFENSLIRFANPLTMFRQCWE